MAGRNKKIIKDGKVVGWVHSDYFDGYAPDQLFNQEVLESMEFFEALQMFVIFTRSEGFKEVAGTKLTSEYFAYKSDVRGFGWTITDTASGLSIVTKLETLAACKDYIKNISEEELAKIENARLTDKYKEQCQKLAEFKAPKTESFDFMEAFDTLDEIYTESLDQVSIFEL